MATLYRKYRSQRFEDVIGQDPIVTTLTNQVKLDRIGHAYLFTGSRGVGKTSCARIFARAVNCLHPADGSPCGECDVCKALATDNVDIIEMDAASNNGVDDARDIREKVKYMPVSCKYKVYIIDEAHMLTGGAFNALLKTIEEPPAHVIFILATTEPQKLPQTILSRCIRFDFRLVPTDILAKHIAHIYDLEGIKYTKPAVEEIARLGEGSVRDALSIADTIASASAEITPEVVKSLTGAGDSAVIAELFECVASCDLVGALSAVDNLVRCGKSMPTVARQLIDYTRNVLVAKAVGKETASGGTLINTDRASLDSIICAAEKHNVSEISRILEELGAAESGLKYSVNPRVFLETALVKLICGVKREEDILRRLAALENNSALNAEQKKNKVKTDEYSVFTQKTETIEKDRVSGVAQNAKTQKTAPTPDARQNDSAQTVAHTEKEKRKSEKQSKPDASILSEKSDSRADFEYYGTDFEPPPDICMNAESYDDREPSYSEKEKRDEKPILTVADEGEFRHLRGISVTGLELTGKIIAVLRKSGTPAATRVLRLFSYGVIAVERADAIGFISPDEVFLQMSDRAVIDVLNGVLDTFGQKKRASTERTEDDMYKSDMEKAKNLFSYDGVF